MKADSHVRARETSTTGSTLGRDLMGEEMALIGIELFKLGEIE
jgi:hypothetical protein